MMSDFKCTCPERAECSAVFQQKQNDPCAPPSLFIPSFLLFPCMKTVLKRKYFAAVEEVKQNMAEVLKVIKIEEFKNF